MTSQLVARIQRDLRDLGLYEGHIDGEWGPMTDSAYSAMVGASRARTELTCGSAGGSRMAWGQKVSRTFRNRVHWIADQLGIEPDWLMACMAFESAETFRSDIRNAAGSGATGLIQFMPNTAVALGTTTDELASMSPEAQLDYVYRYFQPYKGRLNNLGDTYMAILWPAGIGKPYQWIMWDKGRRPTTYRQNAGLDLDKDGNITRGEAIRKIEDKLKKGLGPQFIG